MIMLKIYNKLLRINYPIRTSFVRGFQLINKKSLYYTYFFSFFIKCKNILRSKVTKPQKQQTENVYTEMRVISTLNKNGNMLPLKRNIKQTSLRSEEATQRTNMRDLTSQSNVLPGKSIYCQQSQNKQPKTNKNIQLLLSHTEPSQQHVAIIIQQITAAKNSAPRAHQNPPHEIRTS